MKMNVWKKVGTLAAVVSAAVCLSVSCKEAPVLDVVYGAGLSEYEGDYHPYMDSIPRIYFNSLNEWGSPFVKKGTIKDCDKMVRKTCNEAENQVKAFLKRHPDLDAKFTFLVMNGLTEKEVYSFSRK